MFAFWKGTLVFEFFALLHFWLRIGRLKKKSFTEHRIRFGPGNHQYGILLRPSENILNSNQLVIYFHGGGWMFGKPEMFRSNARFFLEKGYWVFLPAYRKMPFHCFEAIYADAQLCVKKLIDYLKADQVNMEKWILAGMSAGGNLAALLAIQNPSFLPPIRALLVFGAPLNLQAMQGSPVIYWYTHKGNRRIRFLADPFQQLKPEFNVPTLLVHGEKDGMVPLQSVKAFYDKLVYTQSPSHHFEVIWGGAHVAAVSWVYEDGALRQTIGDWLDSNT